jgi:hypothetical protein
MGLFSGRAGRAVVGLVLTWFPAGVWAAMPGTEGETLSGKRVVLAQATAGHVSVVVMGFSREAGDPCTDWARAIRADPALKGVRVYESAMLAAAPALLRGMIKAGMRKGVSAGEQEDFVVIVKEEQLWRSYFGVENEKEPQVILLDGDGRIRWKGHGLAKDMEAELRAAAR